MFYSAGFADVNGRLQIQDWLWQILIPSDVHSYFCCVLGSLLVLKSCHSVCCVAVHGDTLDVRVPQLYGCCYMFQQIGLVILILLAVWIDLAC